MEVPTRKGRRVTEKLDGKVSLSLGNLIALGVLVLGLSGWLWRMYEKVEYLAVETTEIKADVKIIRERMDRCSIPQANGKVTVNP